VGALFSPSSEAGCWILANMPGLMPRPDVLAYSGGAGVRPRMGNGGGVFHFHGLAGHQGQSTLRAVERKLAAGAVSFLVGGDSARCRIVRWSMGEQ